MLTSLVLPLLLAQEIQTFIQRERYNINKTHTESFFISYSYNVRSRLSKDKLLLLLSHT